MSKENTMKKEVNEMDQQQPGIKEKVTEQANVLFDKLPMMGPIVWLLSQTQAHRHLFLADLEWRILPPVSLAQCKLYMKDKTPMAYVSWARVNEDVEKRLAEGNMRLAPNEWSNGDKIWLIDVVAPFGGIPGLIKDLKENVFKDQDVNFLAPNESGNGLIVKKLSETP